MKINIATSWAALARYRHAWSALLARSGANQPTMSPLWMQAWWETFGGDQGRELRAVLVFRGSRLVGLAPFLVRRVWYRNVLPLRRIEFLASGESEADEICSDYINVVAEAGMEPLVARAVVDALVRGELGWWDELVLDLMDGRAAMTEHLAGKLGRAGLHVEIMAQRPCPYATLPASWDGYLSQLSSSGRYMVRRTLRDLERWAGDSIEVTRAETLADVEKGRQILIDLHNHRWRQAGETGMFASSKFLHFHRRVMPELFAHQALDLMWLSCKGAPIASIYNVVWDNRVYFYQSGRRTDLPRKIRPGIAMHAYAIQHAIGRGRVLYDFLSGPSRYKKQLSTAENSLVRVRALRRSPAALLRRQAQRGEKVLREVRQRIRERQDVGDESDSTAGVSTAGAVSGL
ncbi:MAG: GNAT family N-acetyltransferase [Proteobacteria bacterium]|nr:GNAT family N-acetyltransferase [Pseudomonadota bacterium]